MNTFNDRHDQDYERDQASRQVRYAEGYEGYDRYGQTARGFRFGDAVKTDLDVESKAIFSAVMRKVFVWLFAGLLVSGATSWATVRFEALTRLVYSPAGMIVLIVAQLGLALAFGFSLWKVRPAVVKAMYVGYTAVLGLTLSSIFFVYDLGTITAAFLMSAAVFGAMAAVGYFVKKDLTPIGYVGYMLLFGAIIVTLLNALLRFLLPGVAQGISIFMNYLILAIFIGLTAFDMQRIKLMALEAARAGHGSETATVTDRLAINGAMQLYLDFINIFLRVLSIMGRSRD